MPIILTSPHDGTETLSVTERTEANSPEECPGFSGSRDTGTGTITEVIAQKILDVTGLSPYVVIARFHRKFIDANRDENCAFVDDDAKPFYNQYHNRISGYLDQLLAQNEDRGFLFDIHGFAEQEDDNADIALGTAGGTTLRPDYPRANVFMQHGLHGLLSSVRRQILPTRSNPIGSSITLPPVPQVFQYRVSPVDSTAPEIPRLNGGFTVRNYSSRLSCIQIEIANTIRNDGQKRNFLIEDLAYAMVNSVRRYAPF
jgi:hypothetical protein